MLPGFHVLRKSWLVYEMETLQLCFIHGCCKSFHICQRKQLPEVKHTESEGCIFLSPHMGKPLKRIQVQR